MILYHFTSPHHVEGCLREGLRLGHIPADVARGRRGLIPGYQWLTTNPEFAQSWCEYSSLPYDRAAYRITVDVPKEAEADALVWTEVCQRLAPKGWRILNEFGDPDNWRLFRGIVRPEWMGEVLHKRGHVFRRAS